MAVDVAGLHGRAEARGTTRTLSGPALLVGALVAASSLIRLVAAHLHTTPRLYPDEYIYSELGRAIAGGHVAIRGAPASFPALLEPIVQAPFWALGDLVAAYQGIQAVHALAVSLAAIPAYVLTGRLGLPGWQRVAAVALVLVSPSFVYASYLTADALALPFALAALAAGVAALERPTSRRQALFLALALLATFARVQYAVLPVAFAAAALAMCGGRPFRTLRTYRFTAAAFGLALVAVLLTGPGRALGYYSAVLDLGVDVPAIGRWLATDVWLLAYASGVVLVPAAIVGLAGAVVRPRSAAERAFGLLTMMVAAGLLAEAALYASNGSDRFQERYLIGLLPLVPLLFFLGLRRLPSRAATVAIALVGGVLVVVATRVPLSTYTASFGKQDSPFLHAVYRLEEALGTGPADLVVALLATCLAVAAAIGARRPARGALVLSVLAGAALAATAAGAVAYDVGLDHKVRSAPAAVEHGWVDRSGVGPTAALLTPNADPASVFEQLFWNRSLDEVVRLPTADAVDAFSTPVAEIGRDGTLAVAGTALQKPLLVQEYAARAELEGARLVERSSGAALWRPTGDLRLSMLVDGLYFDGWLAPRSSIELWPPPDRARRGTLRFALTNPRGVTVVLQLHGPGVRRTVRLTPGARRVLALPVDANRHWKLDLTASRSFSAERLRLVSVRMDRLRFSEDSRSATAMPIHAS
jgi:hypothetical protein